MKKCIKNKSLAVLIPLLLAGFGASAKEVIGLPPSRGGQRLERKASACEPAGFKADLDINNVRARILNGGDMWWDLNSVAKYEIPKVDDPNVVKKNSLFAGAIWIGGLDPGGNLKVAAMTYRQNGSDYFPGPLDTTSAITESGRCKAYDKIYKINRQDIINYVADPTTATDDIIQYPGNGDKFYRESFILAPYFDPTGFSPYNPQDGITYPVLDPTRPADRNRPEDQPDQMLTFIYNDKGNIHGETGGLPIGLELVTTAFAFQANDEVNNMTFYRTKITNRASDEVKDCYFGQWVDSDLGNYADDYVGCDTSRDLGFCYNGDDDDEGILGYGLNPPSVGTDFFQGPKDDKGNELGLAKFVYYNNDFSVNGNPTIAEHYYGYLRGKWKDGSPITYGGNGYQTGVETSFMFPGDPTKPSEWHEKSAGNTPGDRRYIQSAGPFNLKAGAVNYVTVGVVWARTTSGGATGSLNLLKLASDKAQKLFNNNFDIVDGPDAPEVAVQELDQEIVLTFNKTNTPATERYSETIFGDQGQPLNYKFEGYIIYQLKDATVTTGELDNIDKARIVFQCDLKNDVSEIINQEFDPDVNVTVPKLKVVGSNNGIIHSISIKEDAFATKEKALVNFKQYNYLVLAYAHLSNDRNDPTQFLAGRRITGAKGIPHKPDPYGVGTELKADYGDGPSIVRITGRGNGGNQVELSQESIDEIFSSAPLYKAKFPKYKGGAGPVKIKVIDPFKVPNGNFELKFVDTAFQKAGVPAKNIQDSLSNPYRTTWVLTMIDSAGVTVNKSVKSDTVIRVNNEYVIKEWGLSVQVHQVVGPGDPENNEDISNGYLASSIEFQGGNKPWLTAMADVDGVTGGAAFLNWIRAGKNGAPDYGDMSFTHDFAIGKVPLDPFEKWENVIGRRIAPYALASRADYSVAGANGRTTYGPAYVGNSIGADNPLSELTSIDLVITPDKTKWSKCLVLEMSEDPTQSIGNAAKFDYRKSLSLDKDFKPIPGDTGMSWFPGYAINVETGERLNLMFGEDSYHSAENGADMIWNPTANLTNTLGVAIGGKHNIYIMGQYKSRGYNGVTYDGCADYRSILFNLQNFTTKSRVMSQCMYVMPSMAEKGFDLKNGIPPYEVTIKIRVQRPYANKLLVQGTDSVNKTLPSFKFGTADIAPNFNSQSAKTKAIDLINIVPNPYYGFSSYEGSQVDNRVKFTNLPRKTTIKIFTFSGTLIRTFKKDDELTYVEWDLKNNVNVPIASGMYIIHIDAEGVGTKVLKWFGIMRQIDLDTF